VAGGRRGGSGGRGNKPGSHRKGATIGSGGKNRRALRGKGPTPPAELRPGHPAARRAAAGRDGTPPRATPSPRPRPRTDRNGGEVVVGRNPVVEALRARVPAAALYVAEGQPGDDRVRQAVEAATRASIPVLGASRSELDRLGGGAAHQGVALVVPAYSYLHPDDLLERARQAGDPPLLVALDGVTDPHNLGAVIRCVTAFGGHGVLIPQRRAAGMSAAAWKASAGAAAYVPVARATNLVRALRAWRDAGLVVVGLATDGALPVDALEVAVDPLVLAVGGEGRGLSRLVRESCDLVVQIPMAGTTESLNASVAAGVALYETARRRRRG
jgi:23S rRNA (guanosine2251-2'-O)-methyltransferase